MWRDEMKAEQVDKSIQLLALLQHKALKARNLFFGVQERARFFFPPPTAFPRLSVCAGPRVARAQHQQGKRKKAGDVLLQTAGGDSEGEERQHPESALWQWGEEERREQVERDPEQRLQEGQRAVVLAAGRTQEQ